MGMNEKYEPRDLGIKVPTTHINTQDKARLRASLAPYVIADYTLVVPEWGQQTFTADAFVEEWLSPKKFG
ncbi:hypothetical protein BPOR_0023g00360 [Botrytis porri]|uniref:Uncharacterized protein n=1 Tax=Botrytis porri TaxID=87229 RepID=A0A4Z1L493_9HELO|nr:hypothetical protein BPOR_0023g00360 [Botrytis porri]